MSTPDVLMTEEGKKKKLKKNKKKKKQQRLRQPERRSVCRDTKHPEKTGCNYGVESEKGGGEEGGG